MSNEWSTIEEARLTLLKLMLEEYPELRTKIINHIKNTYPEEI